VSAPDHIAPEAGPARTTPDAPEEVAPAIGLAAGGTPSGRAGGPAPTLPRLRRPSGYPPPLPHHWRRRNVALLFGLALWVATWSMAYLSGRSPVRSADAAAVDFLARDHRTGLTVAVARAIDFVDRPLLLNWAVLVTVAGAALLGRFRRAFVQFGAIFVALWIVSLLAVAMNRPRPYDAEILGRWAGYAVPSVSTGYLIVILTGAAFCFLRPGLPRHVAFAVLGVLIVLLALAKAVLAVNPPSAVLAGGAIGALVSVAAFTYLVPDDVFPLGRRGSRSAHLDLDARRPAIELALANQLGVRLLELKPFGLAGSGGSSPMRLLVEGKPKPLPLFAKLYARQHVRADRWYKLGRAMLYGRLEDERPFHSVRRMVQNEDYLLRVMRDAELPVVRSYGFVELTPDREYMLVTEFADGAKEICDDDVVMEIALIDDALRLVRAMWEAGVAHRDVKPSNLLVRNGRLVLIDVAFAEVHPSPWRQAVDLANMMLVLALRCDAETVYRRALRFFSPDDLAEAFAGCGGVTLPSQLRSMLATDGRNLLRRFRELAPPRQPVKVQKWSPRRMGLLAGSVAAAVVGVPLAVGAVLTIDPIEVRSAVCPTSTPVQLFGQAVPGSAYVPCVPKPYALGLVTTTPAAWVRNDRAWTKAELSDGSKVTMNFTASCTVARGKQLPSAGLPPGVAAWEGGTGQVLLTFSGGCVQLDYPVDQLGRAELALPRLRDAVRLVPRWRLDRFVARTTDGQERHL